MINIICKKIANLLYCTNVISEAETELYSYAVFCLIIDIFPFILGIPIGLFFHCKIYHILLFLFPFVLMRKYSGGYHAKSMGRCLMLSSVLLSIFFLLIQYFAREKNIILLMILTILSSIGLCFFSPIDSSARRLTHDEIAKFHKIICITTSLITVTILILLFTMHNAYSIIVPVSFGIQFTFFLQILQKTAAVIIYMKKRRTHDVQEG